MVVASTVSLTFQLIFFRIFTFSAVKHKTVHDFLSISSLVHFIKLALAICGSMHFVTTTAAVIIIIIIIMNLVGLGCQFITCES
jgi:hypothetical protein